MPWGDDAKRFMLRVHNWPVFEPDVGVVNLHFTKPNPKNPKAPPYMNGNAFRSVDEFVHKAQWRSGLADTKDIYHCTSLQRTTARGRSGHVIALRNIHNTVSSKVIFLDIDVKTPPKGYATLNEALLALKGFLAHWTLPFPTAIVASGGGVHVYWTSNRPLTPEEWRPYAEGLRNAAAAYGLRCDLGVTIDITRILRVPETSNWKTDPPKQVKLLRLLDFDYDFATQIKPFLDKAPPMVATATGVAPKEAVALPFDPKVFAKRTADPIYAAALGEAQAGIGDGPPLDVTRIFKECGFLREGLRTGGKDHNQPLWMYASLLSTFLPDGRKIAHKLSKGYPTYTVEETDGMYDRKEGDRAARDMGWTTCGAIESQGCKECALCPHKGKVRSPLNLGVVKPSVVTITAAGNELVRDIWPVWDDGNLIMPDGYVFNDNGHVCKIVVEKEKTADGIEEHTQFVPLLYQQKMYNPRIQYRPDAINFHIDGNMGAMRSVCVERELLYSSAETLKALGRQGVAVNPPVLPEMSKFLMVLSRVLEQKLKAASAKPLGWIESVEKGDTDAFVYGGQTFHRDGSVTPGQYLDTRMADQYNPVGSITPWIKAADWVVKQGHYEYIVMLATPFAAPLMECTAQHIGAYATIGISGIGKSTALKIAAAVWGDPDTSRLTQNSTENHVGHKMGILSNLPVYLDECSSEKAQLGLLSQIMQDGKEKERLISISGMPLTTRASGTWSTIVATTSNKSLLATIGQAQKDTDAGRYRVFEVTANYPKLDKNSQSHWDIDNLLLDLRGNYGVVGMEYAKFLAVNSKGLRDLITTKGKEFQKKVRGRQEERFWSTFCTCILVGAKFAKDNGWCDFDLEKLEAYLIEQYKEMRFQISNVGQDNPMTTVELITGFIKDHFQSILVVDDYFTGSGNKSANPINVIHQPMKSTSKGIRVMFVDRAIDPVVMIPRNELNNWLLKHEHQPGVVMSRIPFEIDKVTLGRGTGHAAGQERVYVIALQKGSALHNTMRDISMRPHDRDENSPVQSVGPNH